MSNLHTKSLAAGIGEPSDYETNMELYFRLIAGDDAAEREMIERNMALVISKVDQFIDMMPHVAFLRDDLMAEGFLELTQAVRRMKERGEVVDPKPTGYIILAIGTSIGKAVDEELRLQAPSRTQQIKRKQGQPIEVPNQVVMEPEHLDEIQDPMGMTDLRDLLDACCECAEDRVIIDMREKGYVDQEIADALGLPHSTTYVMRRNLYKRFLERSGMKGEV